MDSNSLVKITFPEFERYVDKAIFYRNLNKQLDSAGYKYQKDYNYIWKDTGSYIPDYIEVDSDIALVLVLRYGCRRIA